MQLMAHKWRGKNIKVILNGDYKFLTELYGLSGACGTFPCLWCLMPKSRFNSLNQSFPLRTLTSLHSDYTQFMAQENGDKKYAARHNNSLHKPLLPVELDHICPPYLHILLGVVLKHHKLLETETNNIDNLIAIERENDLTELGILVRKYGGNWKRAEGVKRDLEHEQGVLVFSEYETEEDKINQEKKIEELEEELTMIPKIQIPVRSGPVSSCLDPILNDHRIRPQAYHSRSFVGNHCHKYLTDIVYTHLTQAVIEETAKYTRSQDILDRAHIIKLNFDQLNSSFSHLHSKISHARSINPTDHQDIQDAIDTYLSTYRRLFPNKTIPKQHILEHHCLPHIRKYGFGLGLLGEQGTENVHQTLSTIEQRARGIVDNMKKQEFINKTNLLQSSPCLHPDTKTKTK